jgi:energy-converting hydrogenase Eha subunit A
MTSAIDPAAPPTRTLWERLRWPDVTVEAAAARTQAYIFGNIAVLVTLTVVGVDAISSAQGIVLIAGAVISAFVAHIIAEAYGKRVRTGQRPTRASIRDSMRDSLPILTSGIVPVLLLSLAVSTAFPVLAAYLLAILYVVLRFLLLGYTIGRLRGVRSSWRTTSAGAALAVLAIALAGFELLISR